MNEVDILKKEIDGILRKSFKNELKKINPNRIAFVDNIEVYKRVRGVNEGKSLLTRNDLINSSFLYPLMPWEKNDNAINNLKNSMTELSEEANSGLYVLEMLITIHMLKSLKTGLEPIIEEHIVENNESDFLNKVIPLVKPIFETSQLYISQNVVEVEKYLAGLIKGESGAKLVKDNNAIINLYSSEQLKKYAIAKHEEIHQVVAKIKEFEIEDSLDRSIKIKIYKALSLISRDFLYISFALNEIAMIWEHHKVFYNLTSVDN